MISIRKSVNDLERLDKVKDELKRREELSSTIMDCYALAIRSSADYAVELDATLAQEFRVHLLTLEEHTRSASTVDRVRALQSSFRGELRDYRDKSSEHVKKLRAEVQSATAAMLAFADTVASNGANYEHEVRAELKGLESAARKTDIEEIRGTIRASVAGIEAGVEQLQRTNQLVIAQLQDEIRMLHRQIETERKVLNTDQASGAWNRQKIDTHLDNVLRQNDSFCLLIVSVRNYKRLESQHSRTTLEGVLRALLGRLSAMTANDAVIGRWTDDQFVAVLDLPPGSALSLAAETNRKLSGNYSVQENGLAHNINVQACAGAIDRAAGIDPASFRQKLEKLAVAISGA